MNSNTSIRSRAHTVPRRMIGPMLLCAAACLTACGGGGGGGSVTDTTPPPPPPAPPTAPTAAETAAVLSIYNIPNTLATPTVALQILANQSFSQLKPQAELCGTGSVAVSLDGAAAAGGSAIPLGSHALTASFNNCAVLPFLQLNGQSRYTYNLTASTLGSSSRVGSAVGTATQVHRVGAPGSPASGDFLADGTINFVDSETATADTLTQTTVATPVAGGVLTNNATSRTATVVSGTWQVSRDFAKSNGAFLAERQTYNNARFSIQGQPYTLNGSYDLRFAPTGAPTAITGEFLIFRGDVKVARMVPIISGGFTIEIFGTLSGL